MSRAALERLERIAFLSRAFALLLALVVGGQVYGRGGGALAGSAAALASFALAYAVLLALLRRQRRQLRNLERDSLQLPRSRDDRPRRRVLTDSAD